MVQEVPEKRFSCYKVDPFFLGKRLRGFYVRKKVRHLPLVGLPPDQEALANDRVPRFDEID